MLKGVIFDKDGTLFDFQATWGAWGLEALKHLARGDDLLLRNLSQVVEFDLKQERFEPSSPAIAGTNAEVAKLLSTALPGRTSTEVLTELNALALTVDLAEVVPLRPFLTELAGLGLRLGVATNDAEDSARAHLSATGALGAFHQVIGFDSGYGAKPDPGMLLAFCDLEGLMPETVVMVGDSTHDLRAGRDAGMRTIGVLTGMATAQDLSELADELLPDIGHLPQSTTFAQLRAQHHSVRQ